MPSHSNFVPLCSFSLAGSASNYVYLDVTDARQDFQLFIEYTFFATSATSSGLTCNVKDGVGPEDPSGGTVFVGTTPTGLHIDSAGTTKTMNPVTLGSGTTQTVVTKIPFVMADIGNWIKVTLTNTDNAGNIGSVTLYGDF